MDSADITTFIKYVAAGLGSLIGAFIGKIDGFVYALVWMVVIDYATGVLASAKKKELSSEVGFWGLIKKILIFVMVGIGNFIDLFMIKDGAVIRTTVIFFYLSNEGLSVLENMSSIGVPFPEKLKSILIQLQDKDKDKDKDKGNEK